MVYLGLQFRVSRSSERGGRDGTRLRTGIGGWNPLCRLPTERLSQWGDSDCEQWASNAENARVKYYRILVCVSLLLGNIRQIFREFLGVVLD